MSRRLYLLLLLAAACIYTYKLELSETRTWPARDVSGITASSANGHINVAGSPDTVVTAVVTRRCYGRDRADAERAIENVLVRDTVQAGELRLWVEMPGGNRAYGAYYDIVCPESTRLVLSTTNGSVSLTGTKAGATVSTSNAAIKLLNTRGQMNLSTTYGEVQVQVHRGGISVSTTSGNIDCDLAELGATETANLTTSNAKLTLYLPADVSATFDATTSNAEVTVTGFGPVSYEISERWHKRGRLGSGASIITLNTSNGDILIRAR
ncbi:MAG: DUF4097 family beta strand repeat-containing protein [candidate division WOR-3 bacterium]